jgi:Stigma-specific protein, Stig1
MGKLASRRNLRLLIGSALAMMACQPNGPLSGDPASVLTPGLVTSDPALAADGATPAIPAGRACATSDECSWWQERDPNVPCCGGECTNTRYDVQNCGGCGVRCAANEMCAHGACVSAPEACGSVTCDAGDICCGGACVRPYVEGANCGGCGVACRFEGASCLAGVCCPGTDPMAPCRTPSCPSGQVMCGDGCRDLGSDPRHCGACDRACSSKDARCVAGLCDR